MEIHHTYRLIVLFGSLVVLHFSFLFSQTITLQDLHIRRLSTRDGLQNNNNNVIYQDSKGYIWIGGQGLQRYDGYRFQNFLSAADNMLITQITDDNHSLFITNENNQLLKYDSITSKFLLFQDSVLIHGQILPLVIQYMKKDASGNVWVLLYGELAVIKKGESQLTVISDKWNINGVKHYGHIYIEDHHDFWMLSKENGILRYNIKTNVLSSRDFNTDKNDIFNYSVTNESTLSKDKYGYFWFTDYKTRQVIRYDPVIKQKKLYYFPYQNITDGKKNTFINSIFSDKKGELWLMPGEHVGLARFDYSKDDFEIIYSDKSKENGFFDDIVIGASGGFIMEDRQGNFWCTGDGILMFNPSEQKFRTVLTQDIVKKLFENPLSKLAVAQSSPNDFVQMNDGKIYIGYYGLGIVQMDRDFKNPKYIQLPNGVSELIWKMFSADGETLFFADQKKQLCSYNVSSGRFKVFEPNEYKPAHLSATYVENNRTVWLGFYNDEGVRRFDPVTGQLTEFNTIFPADANVKTHIYGIVPEGKNHLWLATNTKGLLLFDKTEGKITLTFSPGGKPGHNRSNTVYSIERYSNDTLLLSTNSGLIIYNTKNNTSTIVSIQNGLPETQCMSTITGPNKNYVWINTGSKGICRLDMKTLKISQMGADQGNVLVLGSYRTFKSDDGDMVFSHSKGFTIMHHSRNVPVENDSVYFTYLTVNNLPVNQNPLLLVPETLFLDHNENNLKIGFSTLNFWNNTSTEYLIFIEGINTGWESLGNKPEIELRGLSPGNYDILVKAVDKNTLRESNISKCTIKISPPFYRTWWFTLGMILLITAILYRLVRWRQNELLKLEQLKSAQYKQALEVEQQKREVEKIRQEMTEVQLSALRSQMNPHFIFNSLNSINNFIIKNDSHAASDYLTKFSRLIRLILDNSKNEKITLAKEIETLKLYLLIESVRLNNKFKYHIDIDQKVDAEHTLIPPTTIQPFVENAIWHGIMHLNNQGKLVISIKVQNEKEILITIDDNGVGRVKSNELNTKPVEHRSHGVNITLSRIMQHHPKNNIHIEDKYNEKGEPAGTMVSILLHF